MWNYRGIAKIWGTSIILVNTVGNTVNWIANTETRNIDPLSGVIYSYGKGIIYGVSFPFTIPVACFRLSLALMKQDEKWIFPVILPHWNPSSN